MWLALAVGALACGKKDGTTQTGSGSTTPGPGSDTRTAEPSAPPPPPTVKTGKGDCKTDYAPKPKLDPNPMCKITGGTFELANGTSNLTVKLSPYFIDQFEVTNAQVAYYLDATKAEACSGAKEGKAPCFKVGSGSESDVKNGIVVLKRPDGSYGVVPGFETLPYDDVSRQGAKEYCAWVGKALPTNAQWEFAARHDPATNKDYLYPWGDQFDGMRARCLREYCPKAPGSQSDPSDTKPAPVGSYDGSGDLGDGRSPWGVFDMAGNVSEVVADCWNSYEPCSGGVCTDPAPAPPFPDGRCEEVARGGGLNADKQLMTTYQGRAIGAGFRCARPGG